MKILHFVKEKINFSNSIPLPPPCHPIAAEAGIHVDDLHDG
jgi:hypothetical protein